MELYFADASALLDGERYALFFARAGDGRKRKAERLRSPADRALTLAGEELLRRVLNRKDPPAFAYGAYGKPFLRDLPEIRFNLSHSGGLVFLAVDREREVGADIEAIGEPRRAVAERFFSEREKRDLFSLPAQRQTEAFYSIWVVKESFVKNTGKGFRTPFSSFSAIVTGKDARIEQKEEPGEYTAKIYDLPGCKAAVCSAGGSFPDQIEQVDLRTGYESFLKNKKDGVI